MFCRAFGTTQQVSGCRYTKCTNTSGGPIHHLETHKYTTLYMHVSACIRVVKWFHYRECLPSPTVTQVCRNTSAQPSPDNRGNVKKKNEHTEELLACFSQTNYSHVFSCVQKNNCFWHFSASKQIIFPQQAAENTMLDRIKLAPRHQYSPRGKNNEANSQKIILQVHCKKLSALRLNDANQLLGGKKLDKHTALQRKNCTQQFENKLMVGWNTAWNWKHSGVECKPDRIPLVPTPFFIQPSSR